MYGLDKTGDEYWSLDFLLIRPDDQSFYEGRVYTQHDPALTEYGHVITLVTIMKALYEDQRRLLHPERYRLPTDRPVEIATTEEVRLWVSTTDLDFLTTIAGLSSNRKARVGYERSRFIRLSETSDN